MTGKSDLLLRPRREIFDHGLLPLPLPLPQTLGPLLKNFSSIEPHALAGELNLPLDHAGLVLDVISSLLPSDRQIDGYDVLLFLYLQSYKRLVPRGAHKDSAAVADVWPSMSAFDGCLSALSPLQLVRTNTRRFMPSQADEETHQLSYLQKHMAEILALLAESVEGVDFGKYAIVYGCSDATVVLGAIGKAVRVEHCERLQVITAAKRICIANCRECVFFLGVNQQPLIFGDNHQLQVAPYNTYYSQLVDHMAQVGVDPTVNRWNEPLALGMVDPHDSLSHPAGVSDEQAESAMCLDADLFTNFQIPTWFVAESADSTKENPFQLPEINLGSLKKKHSTLVETQQALRDLQVDENCKQDIASALHAHFKEWLYASGNIRHLYCLQGD